MRGLAAKVALQGLLTVALLASSASEPGHPCSSSRNEGTKLSRGEFDYRCFLGAVEMRGDIRNSSLDVSALAAQLGTTVLAAFTRKIFDEVRGGDGGADAAV